MSRPDKYRNHMIAFLMLLTAFQFYRVREIIAALALFGIIFGIIAVIVLPLYWLQKRWVVFIDGFEQIKRGRP